MQKTIINPLNQSIHALKTSFFPDQNLRRKPERKLGRTLASISFITSLGILLSACLTYVDATRYGTFKYKGVEYDVYDAVHLKGAYNQSNRNVRILLPKGTRASEVDHLRPIAVCDRSYNEVSTASCNAQFGAIIERRLKQDEGDDDGGDSGGSMY